MPKNSYVHTDNNSNKWRFIIFTITLKQTLASISTRMRSLSEDYVPIVHSAEELLGLVKGGVENGSEKVNHCSRLKYCVPVVVVII